MEKTGIYLVRFNNVVTFKIDGHAHVGNPYSYSHASETSLYLTEGSHKLYICTTYDVRIHGGLSPPKISFTGSFRALETVDAGFGIVPYLEDTLLPDLMDNKLVSIYASVVIRNGLAQRFTEHDGDHNENENQDEKQTGWKQVHKILATDINGNKVL